MQTNRTKVSYNSVVGEILRRSEKSFHEVRLGEVGERLSRFALFGGAGLQDVNP